MYLGALPKLADKVMDARKEVLLRLSIATSFTGLTLINSLSECLTKLLKIVHTRTPQATIRYRIILSTIISNM